MIPAAVLWLALFHASADVVDGFSTRMWERNCPGCIENPMARTVLGPRPGWPRMIAMGSVEVGIGSLVSYELRKHHVKRWWLPQSLIAGAHVGWTISNQRYRK